MGRAAERVGLEDLAGVQRTGDIADAARCGGDRPRARAWSPDRRGQRRGGRPHPRPSRCRQDPAGAGAAATPEPDPNSTAASPGLRLGRRSDCPAANRLAWDPSMAEYNSIVDEGRPHWPERGQDPRSRFHHRGDRTCNCNPRFWRPVLYQLSYAPRLRSKVYRRRLDRSVKQEEGQHAEQHRQARRASSKRRNETAAARRRSGTAAAGSAERASRAPARTNSRICPRRRSGGIAREKHRCGECPDTDAVVVPVARRAEDAGSRCVPGSGSVTDVPESCRRNVSHCAHVPAQRLCANQAARRAAGKDRQLGSHEFALRIQHPDFVRSRFEALAVQARTEPKAVACPLPAHLDRADAPATRRHLDNRQTNLAGAREAKDEHGRASRPRPGETDEGSRELERPHGGASSLGGAAGRR